METYGYETRKSYNAYHPEFWWNLKKKKSAWKLLKLLFWKYCQTQLKNLQKSALNGIDSFSLLTLLSLDLSGHLCHPNAALRCMKTNFICITIKHNSGHNNVE